MSWVLKLEVANRGKEIALSFFYMAEKFQVDGRVKK